MKNIFSKTTENRTQNGVKSYSFPTFVLYTISIFAFLTLGVGQMWAGASWIGNSFIVANGIWYNGSGSGQSAAFNNKALGTISSLTLGGEVQTYGQTDGSGNPARMHYQISGESASYITLNWLKYDNNNNFFQSLNNTISISSLASGSYNLSVWFEQPDGNQWDSNNSNNYVATFSIAPPAVSGFGVTTSGYLAGSGTEGDPYLVASGSNLTLTASGSQAHTDANSSINYKFGNDDYSTTATKNITVTSSGSIAVKARCKNTSASLDGAETETITIYYAPVSVKDISVYIYVGGCTDVQINSLVLTANPYVGSKALPGVNIPAASFTTDGAWRKYTFTNVSEVRNVVVAREGGRAVDNITITDDIYYKFDGTKLDGKCVARTTPTWNVTPADGKAGGSMTATINNVPDGATVEWSSSNANTASVNSSGFISYIAPGRTTIKARVTWSATGDYCAGSYDLTKEISCTSGATVSVERTCAAYVAAGVAGQVSAHITFTGTSSGWKYRIKQSWSAGYETGWLDASGTSADWTMTGGMDAVERTYTVELYTTEGAATPVSTANFSVTGETAYNTTIAAGANGSVSPSGTVYANSNNLHPTITATPYEHYHFDKWTSNYPEKASVADDKSAITTVTAGASGYTITANFAGDQYRIAYKDQGNVNYTGNNEGSLPATHTYGTATALENGTKDGYAFKGWYMTPECTGKAVTSLGATAYTNDITLYAKWTPKNYTVTLDKQTSAEGYGGNEGTVANQTVTFDATPATVSGSMPIAKNGWAFMGFYSATGGNGRCFIDPSGNWVTTAGDTIRDSKWVYDGNVTLYAYYKKAEITDLIFDAAVVAPGAEVGVTPKVDPTPAGTNSICWKLLYNNGNLYTPQPKFSPASPAGINAKVTFTAPPASGMYLVAAVLRTGTDCNGGTKLDSVTYPFQVAGDHTVTVQYKCGSEVIAPSTTVTGKPLEWTEVVAHDIFGYYFSGWTAGDGVTIEEAAAGRLAELQAEDASIVAVIKMKAIYDGKLTANYSKRDYIYFKSTALGWNNVYVYFYTNNGYWNNDKGAGATGAACIGKGQMSLVPGETDIYYWDYGTGITGGPSAATKYVAFTWGDCTNHDNFYGNASSYPTNGNNQGFNAGTPMFVPISQEENYRKNENATPYYDRGYWTQYIGGTGYSIDIFHANGTYDKSINFEEGDSEGMPFTANVYLNGGSNLYFKVHRSSGMYYYSTTNVTMSNAATAMPLTYDSGASKKTTISTNVAGDYLFSLTCASDGKLNVTVKYPAKSGDYRLLYSDDIQTKPLASDVVHQENNSRDTVSFFVRPGSHPVLKIQKATVTDGGAITWSAGTDISSSLTSLTKDSVYNICLQMNESGAISVENVAFYTGNFYIRTDAANSKWDNYRAPDHLMTYSEYSKDYSDYTHYFVKFVRKGTNVKFVVANDYSPCISDTLIRQTYRGGDSDHVDENGFLNGDLPGDGVNVRFMWDIRNNAVMRAYLAPAQKNGSKFLVLRSNSSEDLRDEYDVALTGDSEGFPGNNHGGGANCMQFVDNENWIYEATVMVRPSAYVKLYGHFHGTDFYFKGNNNDDFNDTEIDGIPNAIQLVTGSTGSRVKVRVIYDFKTDRLLAAMVPSGEISTEMAINADVMFIREHQGDIEQLIFNGNGNITNIKTAYGVMRFNKWTLNNREKTGDHIPLVSPASIYERAMYFISFPFEVKLSEVFGFGTYGQDWIIEYYDGAERARTGWWEGQPGFWRYVWDRKNFVLKPNVGYLLELELGNFKEGSGFWNNKNERLELFFPSSGPLGSITNASVTQTLPAHKCDINRAATEGLPETSDPSTSYNRTVFDSHWNIMSVPTYVNVDDPNFVNTTWIGGEKGNVGPKFLYTWNMDDNTLTATSGKGFMYHAMHAYTVQYYGNVTWTTSVTPTAAPQRNTEYRGEYEFCLEVQQDDQMIDRTYVRLSDDENVTTGFEFSEDMTKQFNSRKANIFTIAGNTSLGGNSLPLSTTQTTVVPVGVKIKTAGDYTFSIPDGTNGVGITLIDEETGIRTSLSALDYTVNLTAGDYTERFWLEISPIYNTPTGIEEPTSDSSLKGRAQKRIIDGVLYIVKDGKIFDARGTRVE